MAALRTWLPRGNTLDAEDFAQRHLLLRVVLAAHVPAVAVFTLFMGATPLGAAAAVVFPAVCVLAASLFGARRVQALFVTAGLLWCSAALVHLSGGMVEAHFHFFIVVGLVALYQDWPPFLFAIGFSIISNGAAGFVDPGSVYDHPSGEAHPLAWALLEGVALVAASAAQVLFWRATERSQAKAAALAGDLVLAEEHAARRASVSALFVNLARRNQSLLDRQLALIDDLEQSERDPDALAELFKLDHLATRIRRNAESLLVLSGEEPARRWGAPVALAEVARAAVAEVEDFNRAEIAVDESVAVSGRVVADLAHLLAELVENATTFSPPAKPVHIKGRRTSDGRCLMTVEDRGIGMAGPEVAAVNARLAAPPETDVELDRRLGFRVVGRLAARYGMRVALAETSGGGVTAIVEIPAELVAAAGASVVGAPSAAAPRSPAAPAPAPASPARPSTSSSVPVASGATSMAKVPAEAGGGPAGEPVTAPPAPSALPARRPGATIAASPPPPAATPTPPAASALLPKRTPGARPAPQQPNVAGGIPVRAPAGEDPPRPTQSRSPEQARLLLSRFQSGQVAGRTAADARRDAAPAPATAPPVAAAATASPGPSVAATSIFDPRSQGPATGESHENFPEKEER